MINTIERKRLKFKDDYTYLGRNMIMDEHPEHIHKYLLEYFKKEDYIRILICGKLMTNWVVF